MNDALNKSINPATYPRRLEGTWLLRANKSRADPNRDVHRFLIQNSDETAASLFSPAS